MPFTAAVITHTFKNADLTPASGSLTFTLTARMTNGSVTLVPASITANLPATGILSQALTSNLDADTSSPETAQWRVDIRLVGSAVETYTIDVPAGGVTTDLGTLLPGAQQVN